MQSSEEAEPVLIGKSAEKLTNNMSSFQKLNRRTKRLNTYFKCEVSGCKMIFDKKSNFLTHRRVHTKARPFACQFCGVSFSQSGTLYRHIRLKHPEEEEAQAN